MARRVSLVVAFSFCPKIMGGIRDLRMLFYHSLSADCILCICVLLPLLLLFSKMQTQTLTLSVNGPLHFLTYIEILSIEMLKTRAIKSLIYWGVLLWLRTMREKLLQIWELHWTCHVTGSTNTRHEICIYPQSWATFLTFSLQERNHSIILDPSHQESHSSQILTI